MLRVRFWLLLCGVALLEGRLRAESLIVATYNVENYGSADRVTDDGFRPNYPKPETEKRALRKVIRALNADVIALQEMGSSAHLEELRRDLAGEGTNYPHAVLLHGADADRHVALLSRRPLKRITQHTDLGFTYFGARENVKRGMLEVSVSTVVGDITFFALHLKSRLTDRPDDPLSERRRSSEATAVRDRVLQRFPDPATARFIVLGDCNDDITSRALTHLQARGKTAIASSLPVADSRGETWTHYYARIEAYTHVDYILVSPGLRSVIGGNSARIYDGDGVKEASDHRPVFATLELNAAK